MKKSNIKNSYHHGDLKKALLQASIKILKEEGYQSLSLRKAAKFAGVSQSAPYRHYNDLESLYADVAGEGFKILTDKLKKVKSKYKNHPLLQFRESGVAYVEFALENHDLFQIMYGNQIKNHSKYISLIKEEEQTYQIFLSILKGCEAAGVIKQGIVEKSSLSAWTLVHGIAVLLSGKQVMFRNVEIKKARKTTKELIHFLYTGMKA